MAASTMDQRKSNSKPVLESQLDLLREGTFSDVTFIVGKSKKRIPCHQLFLKSRSSVFEILFSERWSQDKEVQLEDLDPKIFQKFLEFIYADAFEANVSEALELLQVAHMYDVELLVSKCEKLLEREVTLENALDVFQAARKYDKFQLMDKVGDLWAISMPKLQSLPYFSRLDKETLMYILKRNDLNMKEVDVFLLAAEWIKNQSGLTVLETAEDILPLIRFPTMTLEEFTATVVPTGLLSPTAVIQLFTYFGTKAESKKSLANSLEFSTQPRARVLTSPVSVDEQPKNLVISRRPSTVFIIEFYPIISYDHCRMVREKYMELKECLEFYVEDQNRRSFDARPYDSNIALKSISFYCPILSNSQETQFHTSVKTFRIIVKSKKNYRESYKQELTVSSSGVLEGKVTRVKLDAVVPVEHGMRYCIIVEDKEIQVPPQRSQFNRAAMKYEGKDFGDIRFEEFITSVGEKRLRFDEIRRNVLSEFQDYGYLGGPRMIYKLGLTEC